MVASDKFAAALKATADSCRKLGNKVRDEQKSPKDDPQS
jgi:hypothetical protein